MHYLQYIAARSECTRRETPVIYDKVVVSRWGWPINTASATYEMTFIELRINANVNDMYISSIKMKWCK